MKRLCHLILGSQVLLLTAPAFANPYSREVMRAREVRGSDGLSNVQITYGVDGKTPEAPTIVATFGTKSTPWKVYAGGYNTNTGSGVRPVQAIQMCDCGVAIGRSLQYKITGVSAFPPSSPLTLTASLTTTGVYASETASASVDGGSVDAGEKPDVLPWNIPDPVGIQGLDCTAECVAVGPSGSGGAQASGGATGAGGTPILGGAIGAGGTQSSGGTTAASTPPVNGGVPGAGGAAGLGGASATTTSAPGTKSGGACSLSPRSQPAGLLLMIATGLALLGRRKRAG